MALPDELRAFLEDGRQLKYDPTSCECGRVDLLELHELRQEPFMIYTDEMQHVWGDPHGGKGHYVVRAVNLVDPFGILIWIPKEGMFGAYDCDHSVMQVLVAFRPRGDWAGIEPAKWSDIVSDPVRYLNALWSMDASTSKVLIPWPKYPWDANHSEGLSQNALARWTFCCTGG